MRSDEECTPSDSIARRRTKLEVHGDARTIGEREAASRKHPHAQFSVLC